MAASAHALPPMDALASEFIRSCLESAPVCEERMETERAVAGATQGESAREKEERPNAMFRAEEVDLSFLAEFFRSRTVVR